MQCGQSRDACFFKVRQSGGLGLPKGAKLARFAYAQKFNPIPEVKTNCWFLPLFRAATGLLV